MEVSNIVRAVVKPGSDYTVTSSIMKEDRGQILQISGLELPEVYEIDFSNDRHHGSSVTMIGNADGVLIPSQFIKTGLDVYAFYYYVGEDFGQTEHVFRLPNSFRPDRTDEVPEPEEQSVIDQTIAALNEGVDKAEGFADDAEEAAREAARKAAEIEELTAQAQTLTPGSQATATYQNGVLTIGVPRGDKGDKGDTGERGPQGEQGVQGIQGIQGPKGDKGDQGPQGIQGETGPKGDKGDTGAQGIQGPKGDKGDTGEQGIQGERGPQGEKGDTGEQGDDYVLTEQDKEEIADMVEVPSDWLKAFPTDTASGAVASFTDGADNLPLKSLVVDIDPVQDLSNGDPSPENICPISGWTGAEVKHYGKNLLDPSLLKDQVALNIIPLYAPVGTVLTMSTNQPNAATSGLLTYFRMPGGTQGINENVYDGHPATKTVGEEGYLEIVQRNRDSIKSYADYEYQIEVGSTATAYEPYNGTTIPINWQTEAGTVYGGKLDVLSGVLRVENKKFISDGSDNWGVYSSFSGYYVGLPDMRKGARQDGISNMLTNSKSSAQGQENAFWLGINNNNVYLIGVYDSMGATLNEFKAYLAEHNLEIMYPLATPIEIQLTPHEVNSLLGVNNIFADTGDSEVEYRADPDLYIQRKMPEVPVDDVQINGTSIVEDGVANVPIATPTELGAVMSATSEGIEITSSGYLRIYQARDAEVKAGQKGYRPITPNNQHRSVFYGLAKSAGDTTQSASSNAVGNYTESAKSAISEMLNGSVAVSGTTPTIVAKSGIRYVCGEVSTLDITLPQSGIVDVVFESGSMATVLTITGTVKWANGFDPTSLDANTTYEINIMDGLGVCCAWV